MKQNSKVNKRLSASGYSFQLGCSSHPYFSSLNLGMIRYIPYHKIQYLVMLNSIIINDLSLGRYEYELKEGTNFYLNNETKKDIDLAAHMTITYHRGICLVGSPIKDVFPYL
ncbi:hypothetical protein [Tuberibacillus sp. Marseille-P3662]|uniref:hypothetical protein n=1 Tax=Tuberibacillus sp. Marseille-P3662 TaxID=1965358 RepID=UPI00111C7BF4|nr:hypothetical protein [Tuberibacillus sp. Marseille-P3662]